MGWLLKEPPLDLPDLDLSSSLDEERGFGLNAPDLYPWQEL